MFTIRSARAVLLPALFSVLVPLAARAQETKLFTWAGRVDREVRLDVRAGRVSNTTESSIRSRARFNTSSVLPQRAGTVRVVTNMGRGSVNVIQQPMAENGYAAVIQIADNDGGADNYQVTAYWTPTDDGRGNRGRGYGRGNANNDQNNRDNRDNRINRDNVPLLQWSGDVDGEIQLVWRNGVVRVQQGGGVAPQRVRSTVSGAVRNQQPGNITLNVREGRGRVEVIQQPSAQNGYTGIIRISDPQAGYGHYNLDASWQ